jgi:hypothetical protein
VLISRLVVLGIQENDKWLDTEDYTPKYSAVIKLARLIIVQEAYKQRQESIIYYKNRRLNAKQARDKADNYYIVT